VRAIIRALLKYLGFEILTLDSAKSLRMRALSSEAELRNIFDSKLIAELENFSGVNMSEYLPVSRSQIRQDLVALALARKKRNGFFVEFGATNGIRYSNSYLLETQFSWDGVLCEPAKIWHSELVLNRKCAIDFGCVWSNSNSTMEFVEAHSAELSTVQKFAFSDLHATQRENGKTYKVRTISLVELLEKHNAPLVIDYLSIDTEGSEFQILENFPFDRYKFKFITCEHNYSENQKLVKNLLEKEGYKRILQDFSDFEDWFIPVER
jgi:FkbM family methyltransferase